ncbi:MAG: hypothetical protein OEV21_04300 [Thermoplasmata archaeon]|nr:hypothetical protein [Thermoplasmata archaeon]
MPPLFFGSMLRVDLSSGSVEEKELDDGFFSENIGGAMMVHGLLEDVDGDCIAIGSGPLTGSTCPGGSAAIACTRENGKERYAPILVNAGLEFKLCGFDVIIITGTAKISCYLWMRDKVADLIGSPDLENKYTWSMASKIRKDQGDQRIQVLSSSRGGSASLNFVSGWDGILLGRKMREMNIVAIAFRGMGETEVTDYSRFLSQSSEMMRASKRDLNGKTGIPSILPEDCTLKFPLRRHRSCSSCPFPCMSYADTGIPEHPEMLLMDQRSLISLCKMSVPDNEIVGTLAKIHRHGFILDETASRNSIDSMIDGRFNDVKSYLTKDRFDSITGGVEESAEIAKAYILGICPRFVGLLRPDLQPYCELLSHGTGKEITLGKITEVAESLLRS